MRTITSYSVLSRELINRVQSYSVYTHNQERIVVRIEISRSVATVGEAIEVAIAEFNRVCELEFKDDEKYTLYAANANGTRVKEYPSLDEEQELASINLG